MKKVLFGSSLIKKLFPDFRDPKDTDWIVFDRSESGTVHTSDGFVEEYHWLPMAPRDREMTANECYTLKVSHATRDIHWSKTMSDVRFLQTKGCQIVPGFLSELREHWNVVHGPNRRTNFQVAANDFFKDNVRRKTEHDELHKLLSSSPSYLKIVDDNNKLTPLESKFLALSTEDQFQVALEEALVIAIERYSNKPDKQAYWFAQKDLVTRLHPLWLADYVVSNWSTLLWSLPNNNYSKQQHLLIERYHSLKQELTQRPNNDQ